MASATGFDLQKVQKLRKAALLAGLVGLLAAATVSQSIGGTHTPVHEALEAFGLALLVVAVVGRAWCSLYIGGRKKAEIVDVGPYSISRNPLYVFSFIGAAGAGLQSGSATVGLIFVALTWLVFRMTVAREEAWLGQAFGESYRAYVARTPRFGPDFRLWRDEPVRDIQPRFFLTTLRDGLVFFLAIPLFEAIDGLQNLGWLHALIQLP